jgi:hypothetical protein
MHSTHKFLILAAMAASTSWLTGCFLGSDNSGPSAEAVKSSDSAAEKASASLQTSLEHMSDMEQFQYGKEDLTSLRASRDDFGAALRINPGNSKARLGMALTGVLLAAQDPKLATVINRTLDNKSPFDVSLTENASAMRAEVLRKVAEAATWPEFHEIQDAIGEVMLPALDEAIGHLNAVYQDPSFVLSLTIEGETREIDHAEAGILLAGVRSIRGLLTLYLSYDIDVDYNGSYDYIQTLSGLDTVDDFDQLTPAQRDGLNKVASILAPTSPFMAVRPLWKARLAGVDDEIKSALDILKESMASIDKEKDPQADDLIHVCGQFEEGGCIERGAYDAGRMIIDTARKYMDQPYVLEIPELDTTIKVNFAAYFNVQDYKKMLPYYGFYDASVWSETKPVLFFTDPNGAVTGNIVDLIQIGKDADAIGSTPAEVVAQLRQIIHLQDPTFQGFLPGATEAGVWNLILKSMEADRADMDEGLDNGLIKRSALSTLQPNFALSLLGK